MIPLRDNTRSRTVPIVNWALIILNAFVFYLELSQPSGEAFQRFILEHGLVPARLVANWTAEWRTVFSSMFMHGGWGHIIGNMLYLWIFGDNVEDRLGHVRYVFFYLLMGIGAALAQVYLDPQSAIPMVGASGAIAGVLGAYFVLYPKARVTTLIPLGFFSRIVELPAFLYLGFWFVMQYFMSAAQKIQQAAHGERGGVAFWAHIGGFLAGLVFVNIFKKGGTR